MLGVPKSHLSTLSLHLTLCLQQAEISPKTKTLSRFYPLLNYVPFLFSFYLHTFFFKDHPHCFPPHPHLNPVLLSSFHPSHHTENNNLLMARSNRLPLGLRLNEFSAGWATHRLDPPIRFFPKPHPQKIPFLRDPWHGWFRVLESSVSAIECW